MMKSKNIILIISIALILGSIFFLSKRKEQDEQKSAMGYFDQFMEMKADESGKIPYGLQKNWHDEQQVKFSKVSNFLNLREIGPSNVGGRTRAICIDYSNENHILAAGVSGGVWESNNGGSSWSAVNDFSSSLAVTTMCQNPFDSKIYYYGTGESVGNSAGSIGSTLGVPGAGIFKSVDGGKSFNSLESTAADSKFEQIWSVQHSLTQENTLYVGTDNAGLFKTTDGGKTFELIYKTSNDVYDIETFKDSTILFSVRRSGVFKLKEGEDKATAVNNGLATTLSGRINIAKNKNFERVIYAVVAASNGTSCQAFYKSSDQGNTWVQKANPETSTGASFAQAWYDLLLGNSPTDTNFVVVGGVEPAYSRNGGQSWSNMTNTHSDYHEIQFFSNGNSFIIGNDGGLYKHQKSNPNAYSTLNNGFNVTQFYAGAHLASGDDVIGGTQDNGTQYSKNSSSLFTRILGGDGAFCAYNPQSGEVYASSQNLALSRRSSVNSGRWQYISGNIAWSGEPVWFINPLTVNPLDGDQIYVPTKSGVWRSTEAGSNFEKITANIPGNIYSIGLSNEVNPTLYLGGASSILYRVDNASTTETGKEFRLFDKSPPEARGSFVACIEVNPFNKGTVYLAYSNISTQGRIWKINHADSPQPIYKDISGNLPESLPVNWVEVDPADTNWIYVATDFGLYTTRDGGIVWEKEQQIPNVAIHQLQLRNSDRQLFIYTHGRGIWTADLKNVVSVKDNEKREIKVWPNPTTSMLYFGKEVNSYSIYSLNGKLFAQGEKVSHVDVSALPKGIFVIQFNYGKNNTTFTRFVKE